MDLCSLLLEASIHLGHQTHLHLSPHPWIRHPALFTPPWPNKAPLAQFIGISFHIAERERQVEQLWKEPKARWASRESPTLDRPATVGEAMPSAEGELSWKASRLGGGASPWHAPHCFLLRSGCHKFHTDTVSGKYILFTFLKSVTNLSSSFPSPEIWEGKGRAPRRPTAHIQIVPHDSRQQRKVKEKEV